jgi:hypothetical protein
MTNIGVQCDETYNNYIRLNCRAERVYEKGKQRIIQQARTYEKIMLK